MTKNLLIALFALGTLSFVPAAEAGFKKKSCNKPCAPECETTEERYIEQVPCITSVRVRATCPDEHCTKTTVCRTKSKKCVGSCTPIYPLVPVDDCKMDNMNNEGYDNE